MEGKTKSKKTAVFVESGRGGHSKVSLEDLLIHKCAAENSPDRSLYTWTAFRILNFYISHQQLSFGEMHYDEH